MKKIIQWFLYSSKNPQEWALTIKAGIPFLMLIGFSSYISTEQANDIIDLITNMFILISQLITGIFTLYGALRKVYLTIKG